MTDLNKKLHLLKGKHREDALTILKEALEAVEGNPDIDSVYIMMRSSENKVPVELFWGGVGSDLEMLGVLDLMQSDHRHYLRTLR